MPKIGPLARKHSESLRSYHRRQAKERKAIDLHLKGKPAYQWKGMQTVNGMVRKPFQKRQRIVLPSGRVVYEDVRY